MQHSRVPRFGHRSQLSERYWAGVVPMGPERLRVLQV
jgi:hypothetical protein